MRTEHNKEYEVIKIEFDRAECEEHVIGILDELDIPIVDERWTSIHNTFISYSYKPTVSDQFTHSINIPLTNRGLFAEYIINKRMDDVRKLKEIPTAERVEA